MLFQCLAEEILGQFDKKVSSRVICYAGWAFWCAFRIGDRAVKCAELRNIPPRAAEWIPLRFPVMCAHSWGATYKVRQ